MKHIILEVINQLILKGDQTITFDSDVITYLVETINIYGMSVMKFKRILRFFVSNFFLANYFHFIH